MRTKADNWITAGAAALLAAALTLSALMISGCSTSDADSATANNATGAAALTGSLDSSVGGALAPRFPFDELNLTDEQRAQIETILASYREQFDALRPQDGSREPSPEVREQLHELHTALRAEIAAELTEEQLALLDQLRQQRGPRGQRGGPHLTVEQRLERMTEHLGLTAEQQEQIRALLQEREQQREQIRASGERPAREEMRQLREQFRERIRAILTEEQIQLMEQNRQRLRDGNCEFDCGKRGGGFGGRGGER